jgi:3-oxoacyl-[acyl-carrier-protein] synthase II
VSRVAVTGIGLVTSLGVGTDKTWRRLIAGESGIGAIESYDASSLQTQRAGEVADFDPEQFANRKTLRSMTRNDQLALAGASLAVADSGYEFGVKGLYQFDSADFSGDTTNPANGKPLLVDSTTWRRKDRRRCAR